MLPSPAPLRLPTKQRSEPQSSLITVVDQANSTYVQYRREEPSALSTATSAAQQLRRRNEQSEQALSDMRDAARGLARRESQVQGESLTIHARVPASNEPALNFKVGQKVVVKEGTHSPSSLAKRGRQKWPAGRVTSTEHVDPSFPTSQHRMPYQVRMPSYEDDADAISVCVPHDHHELIRAAAHAGQAGHLQTGVSSTAAGSSSRGTQATRAANLVATVPRPRRMPAAVYSDLASEISAHSQVTALRLHAALEEEGESSSVAQRRDPTELAMSLACEALALVSHAFEGLAIESALAACDQGAAQLAPLLNAELAGVAARAASEPPPLPSGIDPAEAQRALGSASLSLLATSALSRAVARRRVESVSGLCTRDGDGRQDGQPATFLHAIEETNAPSHPLLSSGFGPLKPRFGFASTAMIGRGDDETYRASGHAGGPGGGPAGGGGGGVCVAGDGRANNEAGDGRRGACGKGVRGATGRGGRGNSGGASASGFSRVDHFLGHNGPAAIPFGDASTSSFSPRHRLSSGHRLEAALRDGGRACVAGLDSDRRSLVGLRWDDAELIKLARLMLNELPYGEEPHVDEGSNMAEGALALSELEKLEVTSPNEIGSEGLRSFSRALLLGGAPKLRVLHLRADGARDADLMLLAAALNVRVGEATTANVLGAALGPTAADRARRDVAAAQMLTTTAASIQTATSPSSSALAAAALHAAPQSPPFLAAPLLHDVDITGGHLCTDLSASAISATRRARATYSPSKEPRSAADTAALWSVLPLPLARFRAVLDCGGGSEEDRQLRRACFSQWDGNGSGRLSLSEISTGVRAVLVQAYGRRGMALHSRYFRSLLRAFADATADESSRNRRLPLPAPPTPPPKWSREEAISIQQFRVFCQAFGRYATWHELFWSLDTIGVSSEDRATPAEDGQQQQRAPKGKPTSRAWFPAGSGDGAHRSDAPWNLHAAHVSSSRPHSAALRPRESDAILSREEWARGIACVRAAGASWAPSRAFLHACEADFDEMLSVMQRYGSGAPGPWKDAVTLHGFFDWVAALEDGTLLRKPARQSASNSPRGRAATGSKPKFVVRDGWLVGEGEAMGEAEEARQLAAAASGRPEGAMSREALVHQ